MRATTEFETQGDLCQVSFYLVKPCKVSFAFCEKSSYREKERKKKMKKKSFVCVLQGRVFYVCDKKKSGKSNLWLHQS